MLLRLQSGNAKWRIVREGIELMWTRENLVSWFYREVREITTAETRYLSIVVVNFNTLPFSENRYDESISRFESSDVVVNPFVVFVARETAE